MQQLVSLSSCGVTQACLPTFLTTSEIHCCIPLVAEVTAWDVPAMKVGTLDSLMSLSDELGKADSYIEGVTRKAERSIADAFITSSDASAATLRVGKLPVADAIKRFSWDREQFDPQVRGLDCRDRLRTAVTLLPQSYYRRCLRSSFPASQHPQPAHSSPAPALSRLLPLQEALPDLVRRLVAGAEKVDSDLRSVSQAYADKRGALTATERKRGGNLMVCGLDEVVTARALEDAGAELVAPDSEYLASLLLVLPKVSEEGFLASYETQLDGSSVPLGGEAGRDAVKGSPVVPRSARRIAEDKDGYVLYTVTILKKFEGTFRTACKEKRITVREFAFDPSAAGAAAAAAAALEVDVGATLASLREASIRKYGEAAALWMHLKAVRVFVEAVLRYGLPVNFVALLVRPGGSPAGAVAAVAGAKPSSTGASAPAAKKVLEGVMAAWRSASGAHGGLLDAQYGDATSKKGGASDAGVPVIAGVTDALAAGGATFPFVFAEVDLKC